MVKRLFETVPASVADSDSIQTFYLRLPAARGEQLRAAADRQNTLATFLIADLVLGHLDEFDPAGELLPEDPDTWDPDHDQLATVTWLPFASRQQPISDSFQAAQSAIDQA